MQITKETTLTELIDHMRKVRPEWTDAAIRRSAELQFKAAASFRNAPLLPHDDSNGKFDDDEDLGDWEDGIPSVKNNPEG